MTPELQRQFENSLPYEMLQELKSMFEKQAGVERNVLPRDLSVGLIMNGLTSDFAGFVRNYNNSISITWGRRLVNYMLCLLSMRRVYFKKAVTPQVMVIQGGRIQKSKRNRLMLKGKARENDTSYIPKTKNPKRSAKEHPTKDDACHHCKEVGHCKRNCPAYLAELIKKKKQVGTASSSDIFII
nr:hypothetical protein [Tanacetum cinerariifolium]